MGRRTAWTVVSFAAVGIAAAGAQAQNINVDFGPAAAGPSATYGAAGLPGVWNSIEGQSTPSVTYNLVDIYGNPTPVTLSQYGGMSLLTTSDPSVTGDDAALLDDYLITYDPTLESCLFVNGLEPGTYEVLMYAWMPNQPAVFSRVRHDLASMTVDVGGTWTGSHV